MIRALYITIPVLILSFFLSTPYDAWAAADPVKVMLKQSKIAARNRDYKTQAETLREIARQYPYSKHALRSLYNAARIFDKRKMYEDAFITYRELAEKYPHKKYGKIARKRLAWLTKHFKKKGIPIPGDSAPTVTATAAATQAGIIVTSHDTMSKSLTTRGSTANVQGRALSSAGISEITINGVRANMDPSGNFNADLPLAYGDNTITITALDKKNVKTVKSFNIAREKLVVDIARKLPSSRAKNPDGIAVVIGNSNYQKAKNVDYAVNDASLVKTYLTGVLGYKEGNIFYLENASKSDFELLFGNRTTHKGKLFNAIKADKSDVFIYYSGHGAPGLKDKKGYFVPVEADPQYLELNGYPADVFYQNIAKVPAKSVTVVLDACFSGATVFENISPMVLEIETPVADIPNGVVFSSSSGSQVSSWYNDKEHGMFTYYFLKAIHNKNADIDGNNSLTFEEIYNYISDNSDGVPYQARRIHGVEQTPTIEGNYQDKVLLEY